MSFPSEDRATTSFLMHERQYEFYHKYRRTRIQLITKTITTAPYLIWWGIWVSDVLPVKRAEEWKTMAYDLVLSGSILSYPWLMISAFFNLRYIVDVWSYFSIMWSVPSAAASMQLIGMQEYLAGTLFLILALLSLFDGLVTTTFRVPLPVRNVEVAVRRRTIVVSRLSRYKPTGKPFKLIPLDGSEAISLDEFPQMSTPSTSAQAYDIDNDIFNPNTM